MADPRGDSAKIFVLLLAKRCSEQKERKACCFVIHMKVNDDKGVMKTDDKKKILRA